MVLVSFRNNSSLTSPTHHHKTKASLALFKNKKMTAYKIKRTTVYKMLQKGLINLESSNQHSSNHHIISPTNFIRYLTQPTTFDDEAYFGSIIPSPSRRCSCRLWLSQHPRRSDRNRSGTQVASKSEGFFLSSLQ